MAPSCDFSEDAIIDKEIRGRLLDLKEQFEEMQEAIQNETENSNCDEPVVVPIGNTTIYIFISTFASVYPSWIHKSIKSTHFQLL